MILGINKYTQEGDEINESYPVLKNLYKIKLYVSIQCFWYLGKAKDLIDSGNNTYGGKYVINPSGGLISKGHPLGATGKELQYWD